jgi:hypothetical protein
VIKLRMIRVVRDRAGIPERRMAPGAFPDDEGWTARIGVHAAAPALLDDKDMTLNVEEGGGRREQRESFPGRTKKLSPTADLDAEKRFLSVPKNGKAQSLSRGILSSRMSNSASRVFVADRDYIDILELRKALLKFIGRRFIVRDD